jgi:hypothetical protein
MENPPLAMGGTTSLSLADGGTTSQAGGSSSDSLADGGSSKEGDPPDLEQKISASSDDLEDKSDAEDEDDEDDKDEDDDDDDLESETYLYGIPAKPKGKPKDDEAEDPSNKSKDPEDDNEENKVSSESESDSASEDEDSDEDEAEDEAAALLIEGAPSTEVLSLKNEARRKEAFDKVIVSIGGAKLASVRFSDVFKWATGVLNEKNEITFLKRYCKVKDTGNLCHLPDNVIKPLKKSYFEQCDMVNVSQQQ